MKSFREYLEESQLAYGGAGLSSNKIPYDLEDPAVKNAINAVLGHTAVSEFMNPHAAIGQIEAKLGRLGLSKVKSVGDMGEVQHEEFADSGEMSLQFSAGEIVGKSVDTPMDELDKEEKIFEVVVKYEKLENNMFKVYGSLV